MNKSIATRRGAKEISIECGINNSCSEYTHNDNDEEKENEAMTSYSNENYKNLSEAFSVMDVGVSYHPVPSSRVKKCSYSSIVAPNLFQVSKYPNDSSVINSCPYNISTEQGFIRVALRRRVFVDISEQMDIRLINAEKMSTMVISSQADQMAIIHPQGRVLQHGQIIEMQVFDSASVKNAKLHRGGVSFTSSKLLLVYLLDQVGARSTGEMFHDLYATEITDVLFSKNNCFHVKSVEERIQQLGGIRFWKSNSNVDNIVIGKTVEIRQTEDGLVTVERILSGEKVMMRSSPTNGKVKINTPGVLLTASLGTEAHLFLRSRERRIHYDGVSFKFIVRNAGHSAGFDEDGNLRIY